MVATNNDDIWVFGYGSLMWNPGFAHEERRLARLSGYHRRLCVYSHTYRGTSTAPGLVLGLDRGGSCRGAAYRVAGNQATAVLDYLHAREMIYGVYRALDVPVRLTDGTRERRVRARTYVVDRVHPQYAGALDTAQLAALVLRGQGVSGASRDYLVNTIAHLRELGMPDRRLGEMLAAVEAIEAGRMPHPGPPARPPTGFDVNPLA